MSKIICDICGTTYPDTADCCPICGCSRDSAMDLLEDSFNMEDLYDDVSDKKGRYSNKKRKEIFDYDEVNPQVDETEVLDEDTSDDEYEYEEGGRSNTGVIIVLTALIAILLLAAAFLFFRFIMPSLNESEPEPSTYVQETLETTEETTYFVPCTGLGLLSGAAELNEPGQYHLLNVAKTPEDTTEKIYYESADESIVTVSEDGRLTAISEGETDVFITCGNVQMKCHVTVNFQKETEPPTEETVAEEQEEQAEETEEPAQSGLKDVTLKLKKTDIMLGVYYEFRLQLDCDLDPTEVEWSVEHPHIASVNEEGVVKALKSGTTSVSAKYGDQEVTCMVRCG